MNNFKQSASNNQIFSHLFFNSSLNGFIQKEAVIGNTGSGRQGHIFKGTLVLDEEAKLCPICRARMHLHGNAEQRLKHLPFGDKVTEVHFNRVRYKCTNPNCKYTGMQHVPFKAKGHLITQELETYVRDLLAFECYTLKQIGILTGLSRHTVKDIDLKRLKELYTVDGKKLIKPERQAKFLAIDEFKLHDGHKYATHIIDLETGHILWIAQGKKKSVVYDFINHVGPDWMDKVVAVACDMNSDFQEAFEEKCPHLDIVYDYFHIVKNFNEKVVAAIRKDEQRRLISEGKYKEASALKGSKYLLTSSASTRARKDELASRGAIKHKGAKVFNTSTVFCKGDNEKRYQELLENNHLFFKIDLIKEALADAYKQSNWIDMADRIDTVISICESEDNKHLKWFSNLLINHYDGIICKAEHKITSGKIEGINNKIKTLRRMCYGLPDDEYFFFKLMDLSRVKYQRDIKSHKILT